MDLYGFTIDDAFISLRYAHNLASGHGPVFNPGQPEWGYSNPLWVALGAALEALGGDPLRGLKLVGLASGIGGLWLVRRLAQRAGAGPLAGVAALVLGLSPVTALWTVGGLETPLYVLLMLLALEAGERRDLPWLAPAAGLGLALTRPEGIGLALVLAASEAAPDPGGRRRRRWGLALLGFLLVHLGLWTFHGSPVPNSYAVKFLGDGMGRRVDWAELARRPVVPWLLHLLVPGMLALAGAGLLGRRLHLRLALAGGYGLAVGVVTWDWMPGFRYYAPSTAMVAALAAAGAMGLWRRLELAARPPGAPARGRRILVGVGLLAGVLLPLVRELAGARGYARLYRESLTEVLVPTARWIAAHTPPGATLCMARIGAVPYYSGRPTLGLDGLIDLDFVRGGMDPGYVLSRAPEVVVLQAREAGPAPRTSDLFLRRLQEHPDFQAGYREVFRLGDPRFARVDGGVFHVYMRRSPG